MTGTASWEARYEATMVASPRDPAAHRAALCQLGAELRAIPEHDPTLATLVTRIATALIACEVDRLKQAQHPPVGGAM